MSARGKLLKAAFKGRDIVADAKILDLDVAALKAVIADKKKDQSIDITPAAAVKIAALVGTITAKALLDAQTNDRLEALGVPLSTDAPTAAPKASLGTKVKDAVKKAVKPASRGTSSSTSPSFRTVGSDTHQARVNLDD